MTRWGIYARQDSGRAGLWTPAELGSHETPAVYALAPAKEDTP